MTTDASPITLRGWALILGASSGFGAATSLALARAGLDVFGVHLDRKSTLPNVERLASEIKSLGRESRFFNVNAADEEKRAEVATEKELVRRGLMGRGGRIYAMTSAGGARVLPHYGPVSAAKAALESNIRQLAAELAPHGITANSIRAGVTDTPALQKIPGSDAIKDSALRRNPYRRLTTVEDVAKAIVVLSHPDTYWMTGNVIGVDGGEEIVG